MLTSQQVKHYMYTLCVLWGGVKGQHVWRGYKACGLVDLDLDRTERGKRSQLLFDDDHRSAARRVHDDDLRLEVGGWRLEVRFFGLLCLSGHGKTWTIQSSPFLFVFHLKTFREGLFPSPRPRTAFQV